MKNIMKNIGILLAGLAVFYYFAIYLPAKDKAEANKAELKQIETRIAEQPYNDCIEKAISEYNELEKMRMDAGRKCLQSPDCRNTEIMNNLLVASDNLLKLLEDNKKACALKHKK